MEHWENAADLVNELFFPPAKKETLEPGIDRYNNEWIVLDNPDRPSYWLPVTIREAFKLISDFWKNDPVQATSDEMLKILEKEY